MHKVARLGGKELTNKVKLAEDNITANTSATAFSLEVDIDEEQNGDDAVLKFVNEGYFMSMKCKLVWKIKIFLKQKYNGDRGLSRSRPVNCQQIHTNQIMEPAHLMPIYKLAISLVITVYVPVSV